MLLLHWRPVLRCLFRCRLQVTILADLVFGFIAFRAILRQRFKTLLGVVFRLQLKLLILLVVLVVLIVVLALLVPLVVDVFLLQLIRLRSEELLIIILGCLFHFWDLVSAIVLFIIGVHSYLFLQVVLLVYLILIFSSCARLMVTRAGFLRQVTFLHVLGAGRLRSVLAVRALKPLLLHPFDLVKYVNQVLVLHFVVALASY